MERAGIMGIFHEMKKYQTSESGNIIHMSIPLGPDDEGMVGRECHNPECEHKYFKIGLQFPESFLENEKDFSYIDITCPYCGKIDNMQQYHTKDHEEWIKSMIFRDIAISVQNILGDTVKNFKPMSNSIISIEMSFKPVPLPNVRYYTEETLKRKVTCDTCGFQYAVYGISFHCPFCGKGNLILHLNRNVEVTHVLIEESTKLQSTYGSDVSQRMIGNALEDVVGIFEGFLKSIYIYGIRRNFSKEEADKKEERIHASFQRLDSAQKFFLDDLKYDIFSQISEEDRLFLEEQFLKRHVLTHNLGLVDEKYLEKAHNYLKQGSELEILPNDISHSLEIVATVVGKTSRQIINEK